eukprot:CAMPEP_0194045934 /NCGR_PEP_ID=MMETSP0009_2-20130614/18916_1 /TAXON_ID=210454 /ORGANISM="Grammatophora oceanica, Strain CCMP 410" /LENGTH=196 /DNA_ID=CAMNT_0038690977 /DNA_START=47 /DNA_END=637 /DNA_ORIENTATION=+
MKLSALIGATLAISAYGFAPQQSARQTTSLSMDQKELGVTQPALLFDPLNMMEDEKNFERRRISEIKHGRIAMMAVMGNLAPQFGFHFPGYLSTSAGVKFEDVGSGFAALKNVPVIGLAQILLFAGIMETVQWAQKPGMAPGDVGGEDWVRYSDPEVKKSKLNKELNNGRLAMLAITGLMVQEQVMGCGAKEYMGW